MSIVKSIKLMRIPSLKAGFLMFELMITLVVLAAMAGAVILYYGQIKLIEREGRLYLQATEQAQELVLEQVMNTANQERIVTGAPSLPLQLQHEYTQEFLNQFHLIQATVSFVLPSGANGSVSLLGGSST